MSDLTDAEYRALGRYVAEFSLMVAAMRRTMVGKLAQGGMDGSLGELALGSVTAQPICDGFFAMCAHVTELEEGSKATKIATALKQEVSYEIRKRNDILHGDWYIGWGAPWLTVSATAYRVDPRRADPFGAGERLPGEIPERTEAATRLAGVLGVFGLICLHPDLPAGSEIERYFVRRRIRDATGDTRYLVYKAAKAPPHSSPGK